MRLGVVELIGVTENVRISKLVGSICSERWTNLKRDHPITTFRWKCPIYQVTCGELRWSSNTEMEDVRVGKSTWEKWEGVLRPLDILVTADGL